ncbi:hypothetical protein I7I51_08127 [Histoplasma capsulatum]|uniref:Uncharacterized protein n=1 Tax=Ajellomyces capsulatus TaxID=5037 RepID=A0A8A1LX14_AJECA|nr:hypothetical protein I7I51_08127 [Histoplasma capsulatum]
MPKLRWGGCAERCEAMTYKLVSAYTVDGGHSNVSTPQTLRQVILNPRPLCKKLLREIAPRGLCAPGPGMSGIWTGRVEWRLCRCRNVGMSEDGESQLQGILMLKMRVTCTCIPCIYPPWRKDARDKDKKKYLHGAMKSLREADRKKHPFAAGACR